MEMNLNKQKGEQTQKGTTRIVSDRSAGQIMGPSVTQYLASKRLLWYVVQVHACQWLFM